jgi:hypothetical protein
MQQNSFLDSEKIKEVRSTIFQSRIEFYSICKYLKTRYMKKLYIFIEQITKEITKFKCLRNKNEVYEKVYLLLRKRGANYLSQDSLHVLNRELKKGAFKDSVNIESKLNFFILF